MIYCIGTTPSKKRVLNYEHVCKLEEGHDGECVCIGCGNEFKPEPPLPPKKAQARMVPAEEIDPIRSLLAKDYMKWSRGGG